jgi:hypothetical protein
LSNANSAIVFKNHSGKATNINFIVFEARVKVGLSFQGYNISNEKTRNEIELGKNIE